MLLYCLCDLFGIYIYIVCVTCLVYIYILSVWPVWHIYIYCLCDLFGIYIYIVCVTCLAYIYIYCLCDLFGIYIYIYIKSYSLTCDHDGNKIILESVPGNITSNEPWGEGKAFSPNVTSVALTGLKLTSDRHCPPIKLKGRPFYWESAREKSWCSVI